MKRLILIAVFIGVIALIPGCFDPDFSNEQNDYNGLSQEQLKQAVEMYMQELE